MHLSSISWTSAICFKMTLSNLLFNFTNISSQISHKSYFGQIGTFTCWSCLSCSLNTRANIAKLATQPRCHSHIVFCSRWKVLNGTRVHSSVPRNLTKFTRCVSYVGRISINAIFVCRSCDCNFNWFRCLWLDLRIGWCWIYEEDRIRIFSKNNVVMNLIEVKCPTIWTSSRWKYTWCITANLSLFNWSETGNLINLINCSRRKVGGRASIRWFITICKISGSVADFVLVIPSRIIQSCDVPSDACYGPTKEWWYLWSFNLNEMFTGW